MSSSHQQQPQHYNRGILPASTLNALDYLVDRINAASGHLSSPSGNDNSTQPLQALLVGTNEGVGLSRSLGTAHSCTLSSSDFSFSGNMSEEVLSSIETVWATLVSAASPHVMAGAANSKGGHNQPPHPLLSPLQLGSTVKTVTACYDHVTLVHVHLAPLVVTLIASPEVNLGMIKQMAIPKLKVLLEPVRRALIQSRGGEGKVVVQQQQQQQHQQPQTVTHRQGQQQIYSQGQMMHM